jgi:hypothetical protein
MTIPRWELAHFCPNSGLTAISGDPKLQPHAHFQHPLPV